MSLDVLLWVFLASYVIHIMDETVMNGAFVRWFQVSFWPTYSLVAVTRRLGEILGDVLVPAQPHCQRCRRAIVDEHRDELTTLLRWAHADRFERREVNRHLRGTAAGTPAARRVAR